MTTINSDKRLVRILTLLTAIALPPHAMPQEFEIPKLVAPKNLVPVSTRLPEFGLARYVEHKLTNGLRLVVVPDNRSSGFTLNLTIDATTLSDPNPLSGLAEAVLQLLTRGTTTKDAKQIKQTIRDLEISFTSSVLYSARSAQFTVSGLTGALDPALELLSDVILHPAFPEVELQSWKVDKDKIWQQFMTETYFVAHKRFREVLYSSDQRSRFSTPADTSARITRKDLLNFYATRYRPGGAYLGIIGNVKPDMVIKQVEKHFGAWSGGAAEPVRVEFRKPLTERRVYIVDMPKSRSAELVVGNLAIDRLSPDYLPFLVMHQVVGGIPYSRLAARFTGRNGVARPPTTYFIVFRYQHHIQAAGVVDLAMTRPVIDEILAEFKAVQETAPSKEEVRNAQSALTTAFLTRFEGPSWMLHQIMEYDYLPRSYWDTYLQNLMKVTPADVQRVARKYLPVDNAQIVVAGPAAQLREALRGLGPIEECGPEGRPTVVTVSGGRE